MIRDHFCADPHLAGVDLRVVALVESVDGDDPADERDSPDRRSLEQVAERVSRESSVRISDCAMVQMFKCSNVQMPASIPAFEHLRSAI